MTDLITEARELCAVATFGQWERHDTPDYAEIHNEDTWGMSEEVLALLLSAGFSCESICSECDPMGKYLGAACDNDCAKHYLDWLRQPAETEGKE